MANLILIAGMPATGKSTIAGKIAAEFGYPVLEKDDIKEALFDTVGYADLAAKRALDAGAGAVLLRCAESLLSRGISLVAVNNFDADQAPAVEAMIARARCTVVTVFLTGDPEVLYARYVARDKAHSRHQGHTFIDRYPPQPGDDVNRSMTREYFRDRFEKHGMADFGIGGARIEVDATDPADIDVPALLAKLHAALDRKGEKV